MKVEVGPVEDASGEERFAAYDVERDELVLTVGFASRWSTISRQRKEALVLAVLAELETP